MTRSTPVLVALVVCLALGADRPANAGLAPCQDDGDCIPDQLDKCALDSRNGASVCDTDQDGYGNVCDADFDQSFAVTPTDFSMYFLPAFRGQAAPTRGQDMDCSGGVTPADFSMYFLPKFKGAFGGAIPGPSGVPCAGVPGCN